MSTITCTGFAFLFAQLTCSIPETPPAVVCPPVRVWTRDFQKNRLRRNCARSPIALAKVAIQAIGDRDIARACRSENKGSR
jgi:hypothetical protein